MSRKQLRDFDILELLGNGRDSDLSSLSGDDYEKEENSFPTSELDQLLNYFTNFKDGDDGNELFPDLFDVDIPTDNDEISEVNSIFQSSQNTDFFQSISNTYYITYGEFTIC
ncbi:uncharacterized protein LOC112601666 isoform X1 [Melanaphis sacchari]|uniref:uncharacterized protein LOC112601666 isoform X1 n=1 Tax=Melanaphis sacchari TaxID=742174 RepID=UPI000DC150FD|nr:uncharacterized protein LOC112601666 isoform X1 [Melanaphis sacchari]